MAETLVWGLRAQAHPQSRNEPGPSDSGSHAPGSPTVSIVLRIVFPLFAIVPAPAAFSLAVARPCIVIGAHFPLQIDCILPGTLPRRRARRAGPRLTHDPKSRG
jgi:hypothetical protein